MELKEVDEIQQHKNEYKSNLETELYDDSYITITNINLIIKRTTFPLLNKEIIPLSTIKKIEMDDLNFWTGKYRLWGLNFSLCWFHLDQDRCFKDKYIILTRNSIIKIALTPKDINLVYELLKEHLKK